MSSREDLRRFYALDIDHAALGLEPWGDPSRRYFCTPEGAEIFAGLGCDGVHFLLLREEEQVFCVDPMAGEGAYVLPVARDFQEFLSFVLYCRDANPLSQIFWMDEPRFRAFLKEERRQSGCEPAGKEGALAAAAEALGLEPQDPFAAVKALQSAFDPAGLTFSGEYYDTLGLEHPSGVSPGEAPVSYTFSSTLRITTGGGES
nr:hypothetical protein [uncultured Oscillibacter sp.]